MVPALGPVPAFVFPDSDQTGQKTPSGGCSRHPAPRSLPDSLLPPPCIFPSARLSRKGGSGLRESGMGGRVGARSENKHPRFLGPPAPPRPGPPGAQRRGRNKSNYYRNRGWGTSARDSGEGAAGRPFPTPRPCRPCPGRPGPAAPPGNLPGARAGFGPAALPSRPEAPGDPKGRGEARGAGAGGRALPLRGPPARGLTGTPRPRPAPHPYPGPRRPRRSPRSGPGWTPGRRPAVAARGRPPGPRVPSPRHPGAGPLTLSFSARGLARAGESPASHQSERRWQWTRKLGCRCYCSPLGSGERLSLSSKRAKKAGLPGLHKKRRQPPTAPLQALRGHNTRDPLLCPPKRQLSYHLGGRAKGGRGEKCTRSR
ncbi:basic proline-rich protein-like [Moschus berezovskii]|uniref:basic proline-rich protein-like n=1 Tax=Moschus berezovskii TaxID=68408 RepID=UPI002443CA2F|nr:basic proline-rich protein-like [Moschus berezovskii]